ncbi:MAG: calcium/proton exchanger [Bryobacteraceae bacterium]
MKEILKPSLNWFLVCVPAAVWLEHASPDAHMTIFAVACLSILPLAGWLGRATEHLATRTGEGIGGLLNATFGNAAELIIALIALRQGMFDVVKASLTGSIIGNILLVMGAAFLAGGLKFKTQSFNPAGARTQATILTLAVIAMVVPAAFHYLGGNAHMANLTLAEVDLSLEISVVLLLIYGASLVFSLHTHKQLFSGSGHGEAEDHGPPWSVARALGTLFGATALIAWMSEILVGSVEQAAHTLGMTSVFVGVIVVAIIGNAAEHSTAILVAMKNRMDLSLGIAVGSSIQVALFVAPVLVVASHFMGPRPMDLVFTPAEVMATGLAVAIAGQVSRDGESNWFEGVQLLGVYLILGILFYFLPDGSAPR